MTKINKNRTELVEQKFRPLKKIMKETSRIIADSVTDQQLPSAVLMNDFMAQVKAMVSYPGFGDGHYSSFMAACDQLYKAYEGKNLPLFRDCFAVVVSLKKECHHRYK